MNIVEWLLSHWQGPAIWLVVWVAVGSAVGAAWAAVVSRLRR